MKTYKVYQVQGDKKDGKIELSLYRIADYTFDSETAPKGIESTIWNLCNVAEWDDDYEHNAYDFPTIKQDGITLTVISDRFYGYASSDLIIETDNGYQVAEPFGWGKEATLKDAVEHVLDKHVIYSQHKEYIKVRGVH